MGWTWRMRMSVWALDKGLPVYDTTTLAARVSESVAQRRFTTLLMDAFALVALFLEGIGLLGVVPYLVAERSREVGLRIALGAGRGQILRMILKRGAGLGAAGCVIGLGLFVPISTLSRSDLYEVHALDAATLCAASAILLGIARLAAYWPARRAMRTAPI